MTSKIADSENNVVSVRSWAAPEGEGQLPQPCPCPPAALPEEKIWWL